MTEDDIALLVQTAVESAPKEVLLGTEGDRYGWIVGWVLGHCPADKAREFLRWARTGGLN